MLGLTPDPLSAGVGMRVAVADPYGHERVTAWQDGADAQRKNTAGGFVSSGRARAPDGVFARMSQTTVCDTGCKGIEIVGSQRKGNEMLDAGRHRPVAVSPPALAALFGLC